MALKLILLFFCCTSLLPASVYGQKYNTLIGKRFRFESKNYRGRYLRHRRGEVWMDRYINQGLYILDSSFDIVPGLAGVGVSFRSVNYPDHYIRHTGVNCFLHRFENKAVYRNDVSWIPRQGLGDKNGVSFESINFPGRYIRHSSARVRINRIDGSWLFLLDATWFPRLLKNVAVTGEWVLVYGNNNAVANGEISITIEEGITVANSRSTLQTVENTWKTSVEAEASGEAFGIGWSLKAMFEATGLRSITVTGSSSWQKERKITKALTFTLVKNAPFYYWQYCVHATTADSAFITSKTDIYSQTSTRKAPGLLN